MKTGHYFDKTQQKLSAPPNLNWCANYTQNITITTTNVYVLVQKTQLIDG